MTAPPPDRAVTLAAVALHDAECSDRHCSGPALGAFYEQARIALGAAAEAIRAEAVETERARIAALLRKVDQWHEFAWVIRSLTGNGPEPVVDNLGCLSLPEVQQETEAEAGND